MCQSPHKEMNPAPMPHTAHRKDSQRVQRSAEASLAVPAQGNVDIFPEPAGEGDVPATPEVTNPLRQIGIFEIYGQPDPKHPGSAQGDIGVTGEIGVDLQGEENGGGQDAGT